MSNSVRKVCPVRGCSTICSVYPRNTLRGHVLKCHKKSKAAMMALKDKNAFRYVPGSENDVTEKKDSTQGTKKDSTQGTKRKKTKRDSDEKDVIRKKKKTIDLEVCKKAALHAARLAGNIICSSHGNVRNKRSKGGIDLVTKYDDECEKACFQYLKKMFPSHKFIGEESASENVLTDAPTWIVDPIDGTHNFVHGQANVAVAIGLSICRKPVLGVVYNPIKDEIFSAIEGKGAFLNGMPIRARNESKLSESMILTGIGHSRSEKYVSRSMEYLENLIRAPIQCVRMLGSCALGMCEVARGSCSAFYEFNVGGLWDTTAAAIIVRESGASCQNFFSGHDFDLVSGKQHVLCGDPKLLKSMRKVMFSKKSPKKKT